MDGVNEVIPIKVDGFAAVRTRSNNNVHVYKIAPSQQPQGTLVLDKADTLATLRTPDGRNLLATFNSHFEVGVYDLASGKRLFDAKLGTTDRLQHAPVQLFTFALVGREYEFVTVGQDCRLDFFVVQPQQQAGGSAATTSASSTVSSAELLLEWSRHEALSTIATMRMVDLPLSEAQVGIESEFNDEAGILESFVRRIRSQVNQFRRVFISATKQIFTASSFLNIRSKSFSDWMQSLSSSAARNHGASNRNRRSTSDYDEVQKQHRSELTLERDYFNLRKIILVATLKSTLFGLDSSDGSILWRLYLGRDTIPLRESLGSETVPLFVQRTTAHYQHAALASIVLANKRIDLPYRVKKVDMLPIVDAQNIHPLLIMDRSDKITTHPKLQSTNTSRYTPPVHLFTFDQKGHLEGYQFETQQMSLQRVWMADLKLSPQQKIIAVSSKPISRSGDNYNNEKSDENNDNIKRCSSRFESEEFVGIQKIIFEIVERVHSHGKVLGDRSVLYKYSNPNLVVIAILDSVHSVLHIEFIDAVSGYVVYKAKQTKVSGPVHLIQCENWLTYSYWNEKSRRMEIAVIELYEGLEQTDELHFNSLTPTIPRVISAISQAYIFPQGVSALGVTETEQGLSTRSLLIAMPFGGIYAISKRIVDARRPLEMTPELAEEMLIPYRPELPIASEDFVNYNQTVYNIRVIKTAPSGLESTSLMFAYGLDLFFARLTPSGTFDILKDDFDHLLISVVLVGFVIASVICKKLGKNHTLKQAWQ
ncbi:unnamed protein product [Anisakis simplex]|uniref:ER membrane protein complex subunit 1 n=1 Tax=Anisakis simplex TaxID=6269 RepID=A0A3P6NJM3_ANISI|nr:unnamed protein product [Anisakis simplex]